MNNPLGRFFLIFSLLCFGLPATLVSGAGNKLQDPVSEVYGTADDGTPLTWTVFTPAGLGPWPAVLVIHGGLWRGGEETDAGPTQCAQDLADAGYLAFSISYRLAPPGSIPGQTSLGRFPDQPNDVHLAVRAARNDPRCNGKVGAVGGSSGGSHTTWVAATGTRGDDRIDVGVSLSGVYDLSDFSPDPDVIFLVDAATNYVGVSSTDVTALRAASPAWIADATVSPLLLLDSADDMIPAAQLTDMTSRLEAVGSTNFEARTIDGSEHSFEYWPEVKNLSLNFLADGFAAPAPTPTPTPSPTPSGNTLLNISTRARAATGTKVLIGGFIIGEGSGTKRVIVRAIGPSLGAAGVTSALANPSLQLVDSTGKLIAANDDWMNGSQTQEIIDTKLAPADPKESAIIATLAPGAYTAVVTGVEGTQNIALVEVYDLDDENPSQLLNISTRGIVDTGDGIMIAGSIIGGTEVQTLVFRGLGPSLSSYFSGTLPDPKLTLIDSQGTTIFSNDNWQDAQAAELTAAGFAPANPLESAMIVSLTPGNYTALLSDAHGSTGIGLLEIYNVTSSP